MFDHEKGKNQERIAKCNLHAKEGPALVFFDIADDLNPVTPVAAVRDQ